MTPLAGLVLCGGRSSRMGTDKALVLFDGVPLLTRVAGRLAEVADPVLLASGTPGRFGSLGPLPYREVPDEGPGSGPLAGLVAGLAASPHGLTAVVAVDLPFVAPALFRLLSELHDGQDAVVPVTDAGSQPLHAVYARSALASLRTSLEAGRLSVRAALERLDVREVGPGEWRAVDPAGRFALNLNRATDLRGGRTAEPRRR
jgi:molybdenum cofactor guanylyltransferase